MLLVPLLVTLLPSHSSATESDASPVPRFHPARLLVAPAAELHAPAVEDALAAVGARALRDLPQIGWRVVSVDAPGGAPAAKARLEASGLFRAVSLDRVLHLAHVPDDPYWPGMWHMTQIRADLAWDLERGDAAVAVAVIDTGLDTSHPDLAANVWTNPGEVAGNGIDDDGNGYVDDVHGYDFAYGDAVPDDVYGHGTACAGIIASVQDNALGTTGVAPGCRIAGLKAALDAGYLYDSAVVPALLYAADNGFRVASMSFYGDQVTPAQGEAIQYCRQHGLLPVAAAGNDDQALPYYPAAFGGTLAVGATGGGDQRSWFSNRGSWVGVAAPGEGLSTTTAGGGYTTGFAGTSGACPHAAGLAALVFSAVPTATAGQVRAALEDTAVPLDQPPYGTWVAYGRIDARAAVERILGATSGGVPPRLDFFSPSGGGLGRAALQGGGAPAAPELHLFGVGLEDATLVVRRDGVAQALSGHGRRLVRLAAPGLPPGRFDLEVAGGPVASFDWEPADGWLYTPSDASTHGGGGPVVQGGFDELRAQDGGELTCTDRDDALILLQLAVRDVRLDAGSQLAVQLTRRYDGSVGATERVKVYDWSTASYPYGGWITVSTRSITSSGVESLEFAVPGDPTHVVDVGGTVYVQVETSGTGANAAVHADVARLVVR